MLSIHARGSGPLLPISLKRNRLLQLNTEERRIKKKVPLPSRDLRGIIWPDIFQRLKKIRVFITSLLLGNFYFF